MRHMRLSPLLPPKAPQNRWGGKGREETPKGKRKKKEEKKGNGIPTQFTLALRDLSEDLTTGEEI